MAIFDSIKGTVKDTVNTAVDTISSVTNNIIEKNRTNAQLNRLRMVMKNESEMMNRAYIALGKHYFETFSFIDNLINADYGVTDVNNFKILGLVDYEDSYWKDGEEIKFTSKIVRYVEASKFIKNEHRRIYHVILEDGSEFDCDDTHTMILCNGLYQKADIFEAFSSKDLAS